MAAGPTVVALWKAFEDFFRVLELVVRNVHISSGLFGIPQQRGDGRTWELLQH